MKEKRGNILFISLLCFFAFGMMNCGSAQKIALDPESMDFYETVRLIMAKEEKDIFRHLPDDESRKEFMQDFWLKRDPDPDTDENEFKEEFFARIEYANKRFREGPPGWKTDRGRIYIYLGPPDRTDEYFTDRYGNTLTGSRLIWLYYRYQLAVVFVGSAVGQFTLDPSPYEMGGGLVGSLSEAMDMARLGLSFEGNNFTKKYTDFDVKFDKERREIVVSIPVILLTFIEEEGLLKVDFDFRFYFYEQNGSWNDKFKRKESFAKPEYEVLQMEEITFHFPYEFKPGKYYLDVVIIGNEGISKTRKIFKIKV